MSCGSSAPRSTPLAAPPRVPLTSIGVDSRDDLPPDPDDPAGGGNMDGSHYFTTILFPGVQACTDRIARTARGWAIDQKLTVTFHDPRPGDLILHATAPDLPGFLEVTYTVTSLGDAKRARVTLWYYTFDSEQREASSIRALVKQHRVDHLQDALLVALRCEPP